MDDAILLIDKGEDLQAVLRPCRHLVQIGFWDNRSASAERLADALGFTLPEDGQQVADFPGGWVYRIAPSRLLLLGSEDRPLLPECQTVIGQGGMVSDISHAKLLLDLKGSAAVPLLCRGITLNLGFAGLRPGCFAQTRLHDASILLHRLEEAQFQLLIPTSYAAAVSDWFKDAAHLMRY